MQITDITLKQFRCFKTKTISLHGPLVLISGPNGAGKTSLLEALHYACYMKSFRTHLVRDLLGFNSPNFFVNVQFTADATDHSLSVGYSGVKKVVKLDQKAIQSYKDLTMLYRVVTVTEDDITLVQGSPEVRRSFIDHVLALHDPTYVGSMRRYKQILQNRNALLYSGKEDKQSYYVWSEQLWRATQAIQIDRSKQLAVLQERTNFLLQEWFDEPLSITITYQPKKVCDQISFEAFASTLDELYLSEKRNGRSLFGAHLDDFVIKFCDKHSRNYASRGQQKLTVLLLKIAHMQEVLTRNGSSIFLLDDFMNDFDPVRATKLISLLTSLNCQLIFTSPQKVGNFEQLLLDQGAHHVELTI